MTQFEQDAVLIPKETSWFGYYPDGSFDTILSAQEVMYFISDWLLKMINFASFLVFVTPYINLTSTKYKKYISYI